MYVANYQISVSQIYFDFFVVDLFLSMYIILNLSIFVVQIGRPIDLNRLTNRFFSESHTIERNGIFQHEYVWNFIYYIDYMRYIHIDDYVESK